MKRIKSFLLIAMLSLLGFSSCADKEDKIDDKDLVINIETLKSLTGKTPAELEAVLNARGYEHLEISHGFKNVVTNGEEYNHAFSKEEGEVLVFAFDNNKVFAVAAKGVADKVDAISEFIEYSSKCNSYAFGGIYNYVAWAEFEHVDMNTDNYQYYMSYFKENQEYIIKATHSWENDYEAFGAGYEVFYLDSCTYIMEYLDKALAPAGYDYGKSTLFSPK